MKDFLKFPFIVAAAIVGGLCAAICLVFMVLACALEAIWTTIKEIK
jgi:hypothetical protein